MAVQCSVWCLATPLSRYPGENVNCFNLEFTSLSASATERSEECPNGRSCFQNTTLHPGSWTLIGFRSSGSAQHSPAPVSVMVTKNYSPSPVFQTFIELIIRTLRIVRPESGYPSCSLNIRINIENCFTYNQFAIEEKLSGINHNISRSSL